MIQPSIVYDFDPRNLPSDLLAAIGLVITSAAQTESVLEMAIGGCLQTDGECAMAVTTHMNMPLKFSVLKSVAEIRIDDLDALDELDTHLDRIEAAFEKRNDYAHNEWLRDPETGQFGMLRQTSRSSLKVNIITATADQVTADASEIYESGMSLMRFLMRHNLLAPLPSGPRPRAHKTKSARKKRRK